MKPTFERLAEKIKNDLAIELINFRRCYPGYHQRSGGAFSWCATNKNGGDTIGSVYSATELLKAPKLFRSERDHRSALDGNEIYPY